MNQIAIVEYFKDIEDPRVNRTKKHELIDIIMISICAMIAGCDDYSSIAEWAKLKHDWLIKYFNLKNGTPSHSTICRVFSRINPKKFNKKFLAWASALAKKFKTTTIAIDGKKIRGSHDKNTSQDPIQTVSAWAREAGIALGQVKVKTKSNEITAIPDLLEMLSIEGCIVTIDAIGCQTKIIQKIIDQKGDYLIALKSNQGNLFEEVSDFFNENSKNEYKNIKVDIDISSDKNRGRIEKRKIITTSNISCVNQTYSWPKLKSLVRVESERTIKDKKEKHIRYYISSIPSNAAKIASIIRGHWSIENNLHWLLDVAFNEDKSRIRKDNGPENMALIRRLTANLLKQEPSKKSIKNKRMHAAISDDYLQKILGFAAI